MLRQVSISYLSDLWRKQIGFDPFYGNPLGETMEKRSCIRCGLIYFYPEFYGDGPFYSILSKNEWYYESEKWEFDKALELVRQVRPKSILEIGCGAGEFLHKASTGVDYSLGLDINGSALALARQKGLEVSDRSIFELEETFDMIFLFQVLEHLQMPGNILRAVESRLNPGGMLVIALPNPTGYLKDMGIVLLDMPPHHNTIWSKESFDYLAKMLGMEMVRYETEQLRFSHYQSLLYCMIEQNSKKPSLKFLQKIVVRIMAPFLYISGGNRMVGQTHFVSFRKTTGE